LTEIQVIIKAIDKLEYDLYTLVSSDRAVGIVVCGQASEAGTVVCAVLYADLWVVLTRLSFVGF
jgi:hypothetical protein